MLWLINERYRIHMILNINVDRVDFFCLHLIFLFIPQFLNIPWLQPDQQGLEAEPLVFCPGLRVSVPVVVEDLVSWEDVLPGEQDQPGDVVDVDHLDFSVGSTYGVIDQPTKPPSVLTGVDTESIKVFPSSNLEYSKSTKETKLTFNINNLL